MLDPARCIYRFHKVKSLHISKLSLYLERFTEGKSIIDSMRSNRNKEDIVVSRIVITTADCMPFFFRNQFEALCRVAASLGLSGGLAFDVSSLGRVQYRRD